MNSSFLHKVPVLNKVFSKNKNKNLDNSGSGKARKILSKISGAFMLPISVMAIAGLFLGVGAAIARVGAGTGWETFGNLISNLGLPVFAGLPLLFAAAFVVAFTDEAGVGVFAVIVGYLTFSLVQSTFIKTGVEYTTFVNSFVPGNSTVISGKELGNTFTVTYVNGNNTNVATFFTNTATNKGISLKFLANGGLLVNTTEGKVDYLLNGNQVLSNTDWTQNSFAKVNITVANSHFVYTFDKANTMINKSQMFNNGATVLFTGAGRSAQTLSALIGSTLGINTLQTSVLGGILVGLIVAKLYNKFHTIQLPQVISFFGGKRFVALVTIPATALLAIVFVIFYPWVGVVLNKFGSALGSVPFGIESLIFGYIERSLIPFGLHHVFYAPLWYTSIGGNPGQEAIDFAHAIENGGVFHGITYAAGGTIDGNYKELLKTINEDPNNFVGDSTAALNLLKVPQNAVGWTANVKSASGDILKETHSMPLFTFVAQELGVKIGRFSDGKFSFMMFGLPAAALAMVFAAPKENRKVTLGTVVPAGITSFVTGVTEPIEFTFLFLSPFLFWGFHAFMAGVSFMVANLLSVHIPMAFSGGALELIISGFVPFAKGTNAYWPLVVGVAYAPIYFFFFLWWIKFKDLATPGRGGNVKLFTRKDYEAQKQSKTATATATKTNNKGVDQKFIDIVIAYGGIDNITAFNNCASRLRYDVKDASLVDDAKLKAAGAYGIKREGANHVQAIFGPTAEQLNANIKKHREEIAKILADKK